MIVTRPSFPWLSALWWSLCRRSLSKHPFKQHLKRRLKHELNQLFRVQSAWIKTRLCLCVPLHFVWIFVQKHHRIPLIWLPLTAYHPRCDHVSQHRNRGAYFFTSVLQPSINIPKLSVLSVFLFSVLLLSPCSPLPLPSFPPPVCPFLLHTLCLPHLPIFPVCVV